MTRDITSIGAAYERVNATSIERAAIRAIPVAAVTFALIAGVLIAQAIETSWTDFNADLIEAGR